MEIDFKLYFCPFVHKVDAIELHVQQPCLKGSKSDSN